MTDWRKYSETRHSELSLFPGIESEPQQIQFPLVLLLFVPSIPIVNWLSSTRLPGIPAMTFGPPFLPTGQSMLSTAKQATTSTADMARTVTLSPRVAPGSKMHRRANDFALAVRCNFAFKRNRKIDRECAIKNCGSSRGVRSIAILGDKRALQPAKSGGRT